MTQQLDGKVAVVTGAAQGIGQASARALAAGGAKVAIVDINAEGAHAAADEIVAAGGQAVALVADVSNEDDVADMTKMTVERWGRLDVLMNNAHSGQPDDTDVVTTTRNTIINVSSNASLGGDFTRVAYAAAKNAVVSISRYTATAFFGGQPPGGGQR